MNTSWLLVPAMRELGYDEAADEIVASLVRAVDEHGFREYYNPLSGRGLAARGFGFATLLVDLLAQSGVAVTPGAKPSDGEPMMRL
jgi:hypothetical protein